MEQPNNVLEAMDAEPNAVAFGSTPEEGAGRQPALDEMERLSHNVTKRRSRSPLLKVPLAILMMTLFAAIAYHITSVLLKDSGKAESLVPGLAGLLSRGKGGPDGAKGKQSDDPKSSGEIPVPGEQQEPGDPQQPGTLPTGSPQPEPGSSESTESTKEEDSSDGEPEETPGGVAEVPGPPASAESAGEKDFGSGKHEETPEEDAKAGEGPLPSEGTAPEPVPGGPGVEPLTSASEEESPEPQDIGDENEGGGGGGLGAL